MTCKALRQDLGLTAECCTSCHEDVGYGFPLTEVSPAMGDAVEKTYHVCCGLLNALPSTPN